MYHATLTLTRKNLPAGEHVMLDAGTTYQDALAAALAYRAYLERRGYSVTIEVQKA